MTRTGPAAFGRAYQTMLERDAHALGSVDRVLASSMVRLCEATAEHLYAAFTPLDVRYRQGSRPELEAILRSVCSRQDDPDAQVAAIVRFTSGLGDGAEHDPRRGWHPLAARRGRRRRPGATRHRSVVQLVRERVHETRRLYFGEEGRQMKYKTALLRTDEGFSIAVPGLPGCWSQGATEAEALENIRDAISEYLAVRDELLRDSDVREVEIT